MRKSNFLESELILSLRQNATGDLQLPASKSISIRAMLLAAMGKGDVTIKNTLISEDTLVMRDILLELGVPVSLLAKSSNGSEFSSNGKCIISGCDGFFPKFGTEEKDYVKRKKFGFICQDYSSFTRIYVTESSGKLLCFSRWGRENAGSTDVGIIFSFGKFRLKNIVS